MGMLGTASISESGVDTSCVSKLGSVFPFCLPDTNHVQLSNGMIEMLPLAMVGCVVSVMMVYIWMQQPNGIDNQRKRSVLPNCYSVFLICGIFCTHLVYHFTGIARILPSIGVIGAALLVMALCMQASSDSKTRKVSVVPNLYSVMLICCVLCVHIIHNQPENTITAGPEASVGSILGGSSSMRPFGHQDHGIPSNIPEEAFIPANAFDSIHENGMGAVTKFSDVDFAQHPEVMSKASPKAVLASVLFAFIGMTLKMGAKNNDTKGKKSVLPNCRSMLLIGCILCGHAFYNWPYTYSEHNAQVSVYTGVDEVASWDEFGSVLPDTPEELNNLLEASPDLLGQPSDMLTSR